MFNKINLIAGAKEYIPYDKTINIHEHKAPTDESVRLLKDLEKHALKNIAEKFYIKSSVIDGLFLTMYDDEHTFKRTYVLSFRINGKPYQIQSTFREWELNHIGIKPTVQNIFVEEMGKFITQEILHSDLKVQPIGGVKRR